MDKIEVSKRAREYAIELATFIFGNGHSLPTLLRTTDRHFILDSFARFEREILAHTQQGDTPVAWMPIESAPKDGTFIFAFFRGTYESGKPDYFGVVKWGEDFEGWGDVGWLENRKPVGDPTDWQPLPAAPDHIEEPRAMVPATDVAALVEAAKETNAALERDGDPAFAHLILANKAALAPFTKG